MTERARAIFDGLLAKYPTLRDCETDIAVAFESMDACYRDGGLLLVCGNGGSAADSDHMVGELMKDFRAKRPLPTGLRAAVAAMGGGALGDVLQCGVPAVSLPGQTALMTAIGNDLGYDYVYAQQVIGFGNAKNCLFGVSTSGNSKNIVNAGIAAKALGMKTVALTGAGGGKMRELFDVSICVPETKTEAIQELHLPVYHALCAMLEAEHFG